MRADIGGDRIFQARSEVIGVDRLGGEGLEAVAAGAGVVVGHDAIGLFRVELDEVVAFLDLDGDDAAAGWLGAIEGVFQARRLNEAPRAFLDLACAVFKCSLQVRTLDLEGSDGVLERQNRQNFAHGDRAGIDGGAKTAAVLDGDGDALILHAVKQRVGNEVAHRAFLGAADLTRAVDRGFADADFLLLHVFQRCGKFCHALAVGIILGNGCVEQLRCAADGFYHTVIVEGDGEIAEIFGIGISGDDRNINARWVLDHGRVGAGGLRVGAGEQRVAMAADDHVDAIHFPRDFLVAHIADMGEQHDLVDALVLQFLHRALEIGDLILEGDLVAWRGGFARIGGENGHHADLLAAHVLDDIALELVLQLRAVGNLGVAGNDRELGGVDKLQKFCRAVIEFMVADCHGVEADAVHEFGNRAALVLRIEERALKLVAGIENQNIGVRAKLGATRVDCALHAGNAAKAFFLLRLGSRAGGIIFVDRLDAGMKIVDMQDVELIIGKCCTRRKRDHGRGHQAKSQNPVHQSLSC